MASSFWQSYYIVIAIFMRCIYILYLLLTQNLFQQIYQQERQKTIERKFQLGAPYPTCTYVPHRVFFFFFILYLAIVGVVRISLSLV